MVDVENPMMQWPFLITLVTTDSGENRIICRVRQSPKKLQLVIVHRT